MHHAWIWVILWQPKQKTKKCLRQKENYKCPTILYTNFRTFTVYNGLVLARQDMTLQRNTQITLTLRGTHVGDSG